MSAIHDCNDGHVLVAISWPSIGGVADVLDGSAALLMGTLWAMGTYHVSPFLLLVIG